MEKGDIHVSYGRKGLVVSDIGEQIFLGLFILVKILPLCLCQWECFNLWFRVICLVVVVSFSFKILPFFFYYLFCFQTPANVHGWIVFQKMKLKSQLAFSYGTIEIISKLHTTSHLERDLCISNLEIRQSVNKVSFLEWSLNPKSFVVHQAEAWKWHLAIQKGYFAPELVSGHAPGSES